MTLQAAIPMMRACTSLIFAAIVTLFAGSRLMAFDLQGHRGARGLAPENTLVGFARALAIGVTTLETDLAVTRDGVLVLSHDPVLNPDITRGPDGAWLAAPGPAIHSLTLAELARYDVGRIRPSSKYAETFPAQVPADGARIPTLAGLFALAEASGKSPRFNVETKLSPDRPAEAPDAETFARLVVEAVRLAKLERRVTIQSFDWRTLLAAKRLAPEIETVCLTYEKTLEDRIDGGVRRPSPWLAGLDPAAFARSVPRLAAATGCGTWSPYFKELSATAVAEARALSLKVVPWTVNAPEDIGAVIGLGVDGLITDYPDRARQVMAARGMALP
jgi:glycerophosphoryl diester phosphodiesterase